MNYTNHVHIIFSAMRNSYLKGQLIYFSIGRSPSREDITMFLACSSMEHFSKSVKELFYKKAKNDLLIDGNLSLLK